MKMAITGMTAARDDMLKAGGIWVSPAEVEGASSSIRRCWNVPWWARRMLRRWSSPRRSWCSRTARRPVKTLAHEIQDFVKDRLAPYKYPRWIEFVDELPKTATGKIQRYKLRTASE